MCQNWNNCSCSVHTHTGLFKLELLQVFEAFFLDELVTGQFRHMDLELLASVNTMLTSYRRTKYINIYKTYICLQCFATVTHLHCIFWSSSCVLFTRTRLDRLCVFHYRFHDTSSMSQILHPYISEVLTDQIFCLHLETSLTTEANNNKGFPGGCKQLKQILFVELEWKKCYLTGTQEPAPKSSQLKASTTLPLGVN